MNKIKVPEEWEVVKLKDIGKFSKGKGISKNQTISTGIPCIRYAEIYTDYDFVIKRFKSFISEETSKGSKLLKQGDIIFAGSGETVEDIGKSVAFVDETDAFVGGDAVVLSPTIKIDSIFLSYQLNDDRRRVSLRKYGQGSSVIHIYASSLQDLEVIIPSKTEQQKIASILTSVDDVIEKTQSQINKLQDLKKGTMNQLLTCGIGHTEFKDSPVGRIPKDWEVVTIEKSSISVLDGDRGKEYPKEYDFFESGYCLFLSAKNVTKTGFRFDDCVFVTQEKDEKLRKGRLFRGDIVITTRGTVGNLAYFNDEVFYNVIRINSGMAIIRNDDDSIGTNFLFNLMMSPVVNRQLELLTFGSAQPQLTIGVINSLKLPIPPLDEQQRIASILSSIDKTIEEKQRKLNQTKNLKKSLMKDLLTGKVRVQV